MNPNAFSERELDLEMADALPHRDTLGLPVIVVDPSITVTPVIGVSIATQVLTNNSNNASWVLQYVHAG